MKADRHLQVVPSTVCVIDAKSAFDHLVRQSTGGHCRRTAQELCVIRRSMQTRRARCRWVPHERMVVDALTKRDMGTALRCCDCCEMESCQSWMKIESWRREKCTVQRTTLTCDHINKWSKRTPGNVSDEMQWDVLTRSRPMRFVVAILD